MSHPFDSEVIARLSRARSVVVSTGAGVSAESGVTTFRDAQTGLWAKYDPQTLASPEGFSRDPDLVWGWYMYRRKLINETHPNPGHHALVELEKLYPEFLLITQNVDGFHRQAGSQNVVEVHGNIHRTKCFREGTIVAEWDEAGDQAPRCPQCGAFLRPDVVWFGEMLPVDALNRAEQALLSCDVFITVGTSGVVYPIAALPQLAKNNGAFVIEVNLERTPISGIADASFYGKSGEILPALVAEITSHREQS